MAQDEQQDRKPTTNDSSADRPVDRAPLKTVIRVQEGRKDLRNDPPRDDSGKKG